MRKFIKAFMVHTLIGFYPEWTIMQAKQDFAVKPNKYMVVDMLDEKAMGDQWLIDYEEEKLIISGIRESTINVQAFGENAVEALSHLWLLLQRPTVVNEFGASNIAILSASDVRDLTGLLDNRSWQQRASVDLTVSFVRQVEDKQEFFEEFIVGTKGYLGHENIYKINDEVVVTEESRKVAEEAQAESNTDQPILVTTTPTEPTVETTVPASDPIINGNIPYGSYEKTIRLIGGDKDINDIEISLETRS